MAHVTRHTRLETWIKPFTFQEGFPLDYASFSDVRNQILSKYDVHPRVCSLGGPLYAQVDPEVVPAIISGTCLMNDPHSPWHPCPVWPGPGTLLADLDGKPLDVPVWAFTNVFWLPLPVGLVEKLCTMTRGIVAAGLQTNFQGIDRDQQIAYLSRSESLQRRIVRHLVAFSADAGAGIDLWRDSLSVQVLATALDANEDEVRGKLLEITPSKRDSRTFTRWLRIQSSADGSSFKILHLDKAQARQWLSNKSG